MTHAVSWTDVSGATTIEDVANVDDAIARAEALRNDGVDDVRVFREVKLAVKTVYKVVVADDDEAPQDAPVAAEEDDAVVAPMTLASPAPSAAPEVVSTTREHELPLSPPPGSMPLGSTA